jgi:hypothetical protein
MNTTTSNSNRTSTIASIWADVRNAQRRMNAINRPWTANSR